ncbi:hypothetical protein CKO35_05510 [Ectothiorhodospira shaposhnikovii]|uniref:sugar-transfer associated ATP-grasp domain-containing protein n=1 Tax=Ectothiorhodospira shaposhnikovii TaxID=1054 RepID=UPI001904F044|nr:sugar-transfer associated ATP-grasp domain-containing protein [Ectothiorhodospira shaposhnikovii]MBK1672765.1 hypothetical protein [Ectothiorhodospira shaposhnikovii]
MAQDGNEAGDLASIEWQREKPGLVWSYWLSRAKSDGPGLRRWQTWIWWKGLHDPRKKISAFILSIRGFIEAPYETWAGLRRFGHKTRRIHHIPLFTQYHHALILRWRYGIRPEHYYRLQLFKPERAAFAQHFIISIGPILQVIHRHSPKKHDGVIFLNKKQFKDWCAHNDIPTVENLLEIDRGKIVSRTSDHLPASDLFIKPTNWRQGRGASRWWCKNQSTGHYYTDHSGAVLTPVELEELVCRTSLDQDRPYIVQEALVNHRRLRNLTNGALATVRLMTIRDLKQQAHPLIAALRMPTGDAVVDNFDSGSIASPINLETGLCGPGLQKKGSLPPDAIQVHPDTGSAISGFTLPYWSECLALTCRAHNLLEAQIPVIGWDVAILDNGPILLEANHLPGDDIAQMPGGFPLGISPLAEILLKRLRNSFITE